MAENDNVHIAHLLADRYEVKSLLGRGGMGEVYLVEDLEEPGKQYALKVLLPHRGQKDRYRKRLNAEIDILRRLRHQSIVKIYDFQLGSLNDEITQSDPYILMELLRGQSLSERLNTGPPLSLENLLCIILQVLEGLQFAHTQGIIHRDIKPENIFLAEVENQTLNDTSIIEAKILDFGVAKDLESDVSLTASIEFPLIGTLQYMAPEQLRNEAPCAQSDLYAIGVILYQMIRGYPPFATSQLSLPSELTMLPASLRLSWLHLNAPVPTLDFEPELNALVEALLAKSPKDRPKSAEEVAASLSQWMENHPKLLDQQLPIPLPLEPQIIDRIEETNSLARLSMMETALERPSHVDPKLWELKPSQTKISLLIDLTENLGSKVEKVDDIEHVLTFSNSSKFTFYRWNKLSKLSSLIFISSLFCIMLFVFVPFKDLSQNGRQSNTLHNHEQIHLSSFGDLGKMTPLDRTLHRAYIESESRDEPRAKNALITISEIDIKELKTQRQFHLYGLTLKRISLKKSRDRRNALAFKLFKKADHLLINGAGPLNQEERDYLNERIVLYEQALHWKRVLKILSKLQKQGRLPKELIGKLNNAQEELTKSSKSQKTSQ